MKRRKAADGEGSFERRTGNIAWVMVSLPRASRAEKLRQRIPIAGSEAMTDTQARREARKLARDVRDGKLVLDELPGSRAQATAGASEWRTVRKLGAAWTSGKLFEHYGRVNRLRVKAGRTSTASRWPPTSTR